MMETSTRSARNRRVVAILGWGVLVGTAMILWNGRLQNSTRTVSDERVAFVLAAFSAFVGVFAWLLFNPGRRAASESPVLFFAAAATLFPPPIIGFCLMPVDSPLRGWLAFALFLLCVIAVLSHVPDDFFGVPRGRSSYMTPIPTFDSVDDAIMSPEAAWFTFEDLTRILPDAERPSLSPRSYLQQDIVRPTTPSVRSQDKVASEVDDILGSDFDLGLLDEDFTDFDRPSSRSEPSLQRSSDKPGRAEQRRNIETAARPETVGSGRRRESVSEQIENASVFESFERSKTSTEPNPSQRYVAASGNSVTTSQRKRRFQSPVDVASGTATTIRNQLASKNRHTVSGQAGSGLAAASRQSFLNQSSEARTRSQATDDLKATGHRRESAEAEAEYGTLDIHRGRQPSSQEREEQRSQSASSTRQQDRRRKERQNQDTTTAPRPQESTSEDSHTAGSRPRTDSEDRKERTEQSSRSERVSRYEQRQQAANRQTNDIETGRSERLEDSSRETDRKLVRKTTSGKVAAEPIEEPKQKRRSALDIATAGILGAGAATGLTKTDSQPGRETTDLDTAASQGLFGTVRDLFSKPKKSSEEAPTGADEFESAVESVSGRDTNQDVALERTIDASGSEMVEGVAVVRFERGQKKANIHIPFSPPMKGTPEVEVECVGDEQLRLKVPMAQPYGMRIEARRSNTSETLEAEIGFAAMAEEE